MSVRAVAAVALVAAAIGSGVEHAAAQNMMDFDLSCALGSCLKVWSKCDGFFDKGVRSANHAKARRHQGSDNPSVPSGT